MENAGKNSMPAPPRRSPYWDNLKGVLIFLVVVGHFFLSRDGAAGMVAGWIYLFHMPAFIFVAGYLSSRRSLRVPGMLKLLLLFVLLQYGMQPFCYGWHPSRYTWTENIYSAWFLLALFIYRLGVPLLDKVDKRLFLGVSLLLSLAVGFTLEFGAWALYKIVALWPFFIAGHMLRGRVPMTGLQYSLGKKIAWGCVAVAISLVGWWMLQAGHLSGRQWMWLPYEYAWDFPARVLMLAGGFAAIFCMLALVPAGRVPFITTWGGTSLVIYVLHRPISIMMNMLFPEVAAGWCLLAAVASIFLLGTPCVSRLFGRGIDYLVGGVLFSKNKLQTLSAWGVLALVMLPLCLSPLKRVCVRLADGDADASIISLSSERR